jgi:rhomboid protease GluP
MDTRQAQALLGLPDSHSPSDLDAAYRRHLDQMRSRLAHGTAPEVREYLQQLKAAYGVLQSLGGPEQKATPNQSSLEDAQEAATAAPLVESSPQPPTEPPANPTPPLASTLPAAPASPPPHLVLPVSFHTFLARDSRYRGKGEIRIDPAAGTLAVQGRKFLRLWRSQDVFPLDRIRNLRLDGKTVHFSLALPSRGLWRAVLTCATPEAAARLAEQLPSHSDPALFTPQDAQREMEEKLKALSPGTPMTLALIALNVLAYLALGTKGLGWAAVKPDDLIHWGGNFSPLTMDGQTWRLLSAMFMHAGFTHLAFNMVALYLFGRTVERIHGPLPYLALYLMAGLAGGIATLLTKPAVVGVGASGAIFGLMGLLVAFFLADRSFLSPQSRKSLLINAAVFSGYYLVQGFGKAGIDNAAHMGGLLCGLLTGYVVGTPARLDTSAQGRASRLLPALGLATALVLAGYGLAPDIRPDYRQHLALVDLTEQISQGDKATQQDLQDIATRAKRNAISDEEAAAILDRLSQRYGALETKLRLLTPHAQGLRQRQQVFLRYVTLRKEAFDILYRAAIAHDDKGTERFKAKIEESTAALKDLNGLKHWYP